MTVEQLYTGCLAEAAYYVESNGEAVIIDPLRETKPYLQRAAKDNAKIKFVLLTHFHADFVSGHVDLANSSGAKIVLGPTAEAEFDFHRASDQEVLEVGNIKIKVLSTPGHTLESVTYLLLDENGKEHCIFTGDTLFIGDVGRPDLAVKDGKVSQEDLAKMLFHSLRTKIMTLPDATIVYPAHGAGSACGKNMSKETFDTLRSQKKLNYALRGVMSEKDFVAEVLNGLSAPPLYFPENVLMNKKINPEIDKVVRQGTVALKPREFQMLVEEGALMLDVRSGSEFILEHIPGSIFIGLDGNFAPWVGALIPDIRQKIVLIVDENREEEAVTRLSRIGFDYSLGYLAGGIVAWKSNGGEVDSIQRISPNDFEKELTKGKLNVLDVRRTGEYEAEHLSCAENLPLDEISAALSRMDTKKTYHVHCQSGYRSIIFESILKSRGFHKLVDVGGGFKGIKELTKIPLTDFKCASAK